jgi:glycerol-3-phosphate acyltransferase PlsY
MIGYCFGCIQSAYIIGRLFFHIDIREHGSGSAGMTNAFRVLGGKAGAAVFIVDFLKAFAAFYLCRLMFNNADGGLILPGLYAGAGAIIGHNFPFYLKFKGGKGVAAFLGLTLALDWRSACIVYAVGVIIIAFTRYISLASLIMTLLAPILLFLFGLPPEVYIAVFALAAVTWFQHRGNIVRLATKKERKFDFGKTKALNEKG